MHTKLWILAAAVALFFTACGKSDQAATSSSTPAVSSSSAPAATSSTAYEEGSIKKGDQGLCAVCVANGKPAEEEAVAETLDYKGKTYAFCNESEKAEFISNPSKYASSGQ